MTEDENNPEKTLEDDIKELEEEDKDLDQNYENEEEETPEEKENLEESEANPETIEEFLKAEEEEEIRAKKLRILNTILKQQTDTEFSSFLQEHIEIENMTKVFCFALMKIVEETANTFTLTVKRENDMIRLDYQFFDKDGYRVYFEKDGTVSTIYSEEDKRRLK